MKNIFYSKKILSSVFATVAVLYFMMTTPSPKIIFVPFLICGLAMTARYVALYLGKEKIAASFHMLFVAGFLLFLFGFLFAADFYALRHEYALLVFSIPFWLAGFWILRKAFRRFRAGEGADRGAGKAEGAGGTRIAGGAGPKVSFPVIMGTVLVVAAVLAGVVVLYLGIRDGSTELVFTGAFFTFGAMTFVLAALKIQGVFDNAKVDILGIYMGAVIAAVGFGFFALKYGEALSLAQMAEELGLWIAVPVLMFAGGIVQIVKSLNRKA